MYKMFNGHSAAEEQRKKRSMSTGGRVGIYIKFQIQIITFNVICEPFTLFLRLLLLGLVGQRTDWTETGVENEEARNLNEMRYLLCFCVY